MKIGLIPFYHSVTSQASRVMSKVKSLLSTLDI